MHTRISQQMFGLTIQYGICPFSNVPSFALWDTHTFTWCIVNLSDNHPKEWPMLQVLCLRQATLKQQSLPLALHTLHISFPHKKKKKKILETNTHTHTHTTRPQKRWSTQVKPTRSHCLHTPYTHMHMNVTILYLPRRSARLTTAGSYGYQKQSLTACCENNRTGGILMPACVGS